MKKKRSKRSYILVDLNLGFVERHDNISDMVAHIQKQVLNHGAEQVKETCAVYEITGRLDITVDETPRVTIG